MSEQSKIRNYDALKEEHRKQTEQEAQEKQNSRDEEAQQKLESLTAENQRKQADIEEETRRNDEDQKQEALRVEKAAKENAERLEQQAYEMQALREAHKRLEAYRKEQAATAAKAPQQEPEQRQTQERGQASPEGEIRNAHSRYAQALGQHYDARDPYGSLARSSMAEYGVFMRDRENLNRQIAQTKDPAAREMLEMRKEIEGADYMALTSRRIAVQSELITGKLDGPEAQRQRERADVYQQQSKELREQLRARQKERDGIAPDEKSKAAGLSREPRSPDSSNSPRRAQAKQDPQKEQDRLARAKARTEQLRKDSKEKQLGKDLEL